jgi:hypothetical protein
MRAKDAMQVPHSSLDHGSEGSKNVTKENPPVSAVIPCSTRKAWPKEARSSIQGEAE